MGEAAENHCLSIITGLTGPDTPVLKSGTIYRINRLISAVPSCLLAEGSVMRGI